MIQAFWTKGLIVNMERNMRLKEKLFFNYFKF